VTQVIRSLPCSVMELGEKVAKAMICVCAGRMRLPVPCQQNCGIPGNGGVNGGHDGNKPPFPARGRH
jgi:hypothetical protein